MDRTRNRSEDGPVRFRVDRRLPTLKDDVYSALVDRAKSGR
jgi:hypothetical protein